MHEAQEFIADQLKSTGEFARVEIGYKFGSSVNSILNEQSKRNIYAEKNNFPLYLLLYMRTSVYRRVN